MARLPGRDDLGVRPVPQSRRGVATNSAAGAIGYAVEGLGNKIAGIAEQKFEREDQLEYAAARAARTKADADLRTSLQDDPNYGTFEQRYQEGMAKATEAATSMIKNRANRAAFEIESSSEIARGASVINGMARDRRIDAENGLGMAAIGIFRKAAVEAPDDKQRELSLKSIGETIDGLRQKGNLTAVAAQTMKQQQAEGFFADAVDYRLKQNDLAGATYLFARYRSRMNPSDVNRFGGQIADLTNDESIEDYGREVDLWGKGQSPSTGPEGAGASFARMVTITMHVGEGTGGKDRTPTGQVITSPKGAQGRMQVMPGTNADPGFGVTPARDGSDGERARVGREYLAAMMRRYGTPERAWAAYNAGPGAVDNAVARATKEGHPGEWLSHLPKETQDYVGRNMKALGGGGEAPPTTTYPPLDEYLAHADRALPENAPASMRRAYRNEAIRAWQLRHGEQEEAQQREESDLSVRFDDGKLTREEVEKKYGAGEISPQARARLIGGIVEQEKQQRDLMERAGRVSAGFADPKDAKDRKVVDQLFVSAQPQIRQLSESDQIRAYTDFANRVGFVPDAMMAGIRRQLRDPNPDHRAWAAQLVQAVIDRNPAYTNDFNQEDISGALQINSYRAAGMTNQEAVTRVDQDAHITKEQRDGRERAYSQTTSDPHNKSYDASRVVGSEFGVTVDAKSNGAAIADFEELRKREYVRTGDLDLATRTALATMHRSWAMSYVNNATGQLMKYPPELFYGRLGDPKLDAEWIHEQAAKELLGTGIGNPGMEDRLMLIPHQTVAPINGQPVYQGVLRQADGSWVTVADERGRAKVFVPNYDKSPAGKRERGKAGASVEAAREARRRRGGVEETGDPSMYMMN